MLFLVPARHNAAAGDGLGVYFSLGTELIFTYKPLDVNGFLLVDHAVTISNELVQLQPQWAWTIFNFYMRTYVP